MTNSIPQECEQDEDGILAAFREPIYDAFVLCEPLHEALLFHLPQSSRQDAGRQPGIVAEDLPEPIQLEERQVPQDQQSPLPSQPTDAFTDRVRLVREKRIDPLGRLLRLSSAHRYPVSPWSLYLVSNGYHFLTARRRLGGQHY